MRRLTIPVALAALLLVAPAAQALDVPVEFDYAVLDTPATPDATVVSPEGGSIKATAAVDPVTGDFTIDPATFDFPQYSFSSPIPGTIDVTLNAPATGNVSFATGKVTLNADFKANVNTSLGACNVDTGPITLSTENTEPLPGQAFPPGPTGVVTGPGALGVSWQSLTVGNDPGCALIGQFVNGPGGFWISKGIAPPTEAPQYDVVALGVKVKPKKQTAKKNKKATFKVTVNNPGQTDATGVKLCAKVGKGKQKCAKLGTLAAGAKKTTYVRAKREEDLEGRLHRQGHRRQAGQGHSRS